MASITLGMTYVNLVSTGALVKAYTGKGRARQHSQEGSVEKFAGGRFRSISVEGIEEVQTFMLRDLSYTDVLTLITWIGETVLVRDNRGRRMFGTYFSVPYTDGSDANYYDVSLTVGAVSYNEGG